MKKKSKKWKNQLNPAIIYVSTLKLSLAFISIDMLLLNVINVCYIIAEMNEYADFVQIKIYRFCEE